MDTLRSNSVINLVIELHLLISVLQLFHDTDIFVALWYLHIYSNFCYTVLDNFILWHFISIINCVILKELYNLYCLL